MVVWRWMKAEGPARTLGVVTGGFRVLGLIQRNPVFGETAPGIKSLTPSRAPPYSYPATV